MKILTVIIAARHAGPFVKDCVLSIERQWLPEGWKLEVLIGVDACDATASAIGSFLRGPIRGFYSRDWVGSAAIFNSLARHARGEAIVRFDADDIMLDGHLATLIFNMFDLQLADIVRTGPFLSMNG